MFTDDDDPIKTNANEKFVYEVCLTDSLKMLKKEGFINLCKKYGDIINVSFHKNTLENTAYIEFKSESSIHTIINDKLDFPSFINIVISHRTQMCMQRAMTAGLREGEKENDGINKRVDNDGFEAISSEESLPISHLMRHPVYFGPNTSGNILLEESRQIKMNEEVKPYNLENDHLFGRPLNSKWEKIEKPEFGLNNFDFNFRFENCTGGEIKIEKKLSPNMFTGWATFFNAGENVHEKLKSISNDIECSDDLNLESLKYGMLIGAFDYDTKLYGRGYITLIAGNSVNVALSDFGRVINTTKIKVLPTQHTQIPAYAFIVHTRTNCVSQLKDLCYVFKVRSVTAERIVLNMFNGNNEIKVQLKKWQPTIEESGIPYVDFKSGSSVELLKLKDMESVYIRTRGKIYLNIFFSTWNSVATYCYKNPQPLCREPFYGEIIGFKSSNKNYVRGKIHKYLGNNIYRVKHIDNPVKENIKLSEMIELQFEHKSMPMSYLKVGLKDAYSYPIQLNAKDFVNLLIGAKFKMHFDDSKPDGWKYIDLNISAVSENFNAILSGLVEPSWFQNRSIDPSSTSTNVFYHNHLIKHELKEKTVVKMKFITYYDGIFYMRDYKFGKSFTLLCTMINEYCSVSSNPYLPHPEEACLGLFADGMWYRVVCDHMKPGEMSRVHFVDLGNVAFLNPENMRRLPEELVFHPIHVYPCILDISQDIGNIDVNKLAVLEKYENTDIEFTIVENLKDKNHYLIKCPFFEDFLK